MPGPIFTEPVAEYVWNTKYRLHEDGVPSEANMRATCSRVALALSRPELHHRDEWCERFFAGRPNFSWCRRAASGHGSVMTLPVNDYAWSLFRQLHGQKVPLPGCFVEVYDVDPLAQLRLQSRMQAHVDQSISKTINFPAGASFDQCRDVFMQAYRLGLKGCTVFRPQSVTGAVLSPSCKNALSRSCS